MHIKRVGSYEMKTHLSALLDSVAHGERVVITRKGVPMAVLIPYKEENHSTEEAIEAILAFRKNMHLNLKGLSIRDMKEEGRRI